MRSALLAAVCLSQLLIATPSTHAAGSPEGTVEAARSTLAEIVSIPGRRIPQKLLMDAQAVAIIPDVIKIGFVAGIRRGRGVVIVRDKDGDWSLPQFITLTGGSVGWQAGAQATDVVLVFRTRRSVDNLLQGKFTIGADAAAAAGPVGRNFEAATDAELKAEILSYSRSRGLFAGVSLDGSALQVDEGAHIAFYGAPTQQLPVQVPDSASRLVTALSLLTVPANQQPGVPGAAGTPAPAPRPVDRQAEAQLEALRQDLSHGGQQLSGLLDDTWKRYLALPAEIYQGGKHPSLESVRAALAQFDAVSSRPQYRALSDRPEFQTVHALLRKYAESLSSAGTLILPPPPTQDGPVLR